MKTFSTLLAATALTIVLIGSASADYYEFSQYGGVGTEYDVESYGNTVYWKYGNSVWSIDVAVADMAKVNEPVYLADGVTPNPNYQTRVFSNPQYVYLNGPTLLGSSIGEMYVDAHYIYGADSSGDVHRFAKNGGYAGKVVTSAGTLTGGWGAGATFLSYGGGRWWAANESRRVYSSTGSGWNYEFTWYNMAGSHGDGMEYVNGHVFVSDMTSNYIAMWDEVNGSWTETERFSYDELGGAAKVVEGMGYGALGHFWAGAGNVVYEVGGGSIQNYVVPVPAAALLGLLGLGTAGWRLRKRA